MDEKLREIYEVDCFTAGSVGTPFPENSYNVGSIEEVAEILKNVSRPISGICLVEVHIIHEQGIKDEVQDLIKGRTYTMRQQLELLVNFGAGAGYKVEHHPNYNVNIDFVLGLINEELAQKDAEIENIIVGCNDQLAEKDAEIAGLVEALKRLASSEGFKAIGNIPDDMWGDEIKARQEYAQQSLKRIKGKP